MVRWGDNNVGEENDEESVDTARVSLDDSHDPYFPPVVTLPLVEVTTITTTNTTTTARTRLYQFFRK